MVERIVAQRLKASVREQGGLIHKDMQSMHTDIAQLRQGKSDTSQLVVVLDCCNATMGVRWEASCIMACMERRDGSWYVLEGVMVHGTLVV